MQSEATTDTPKNITITTKDFRVKIANNMQV
jgi:hypothetical protein